MHKDKKIVNNILLKFKKIPKSIIGVIFCIVILILPMIDDKVAWGHDYSFHTTNMILTNKYIGFTKFNFILPKIFGENIANGFGYGTGIFYPPLSYYLTSNIAHFLELFNFDKGLSIKCIEIFVIILSSITMYIFLKRIFKDNKVASIGSISYISSTYFLCDIYVRSAIAEMLTFIFIPLIFLGLYELFWGDEKKFLPLFTIGYIGMINSHLVLSVYLTIIIIIIFLCFLEEILKKEKIKKLLLASIVILLISSPYLVPLLEHKIFGNYVVFEPNSMYSIDSIKFNSLKIDNFITEGTIGNNGIKVYINHIVFIISIITIVFNKTIFSKKNQCIYKITIIIIVVSAFISSSYFPWDKMPSFLKMLQFPWRLCGITAFGLSILAGNVVKIIKGNNEQLIITTIALGITLFGFNTISRDKIIYPKQLENMNMGVQSEYLPSKTKKNISYFNSRNSDIIIKKGDAQITILENNTPYLKAKVVSNTDIICIELPRLYYLGYSITLTNDKGNQKEIEYYENEYGFIELELDESGILEIEYKGTLANKMANYICIGTIIVLFTVIIYKIYKKQITICYTYNTRSNSYEKGPNKKNIKKIKR